LELPRSISTFTTKSHAVEIDLGTSKIDLGPSKIDLGTSKIDLGTSKIDLGTKYQQHCGRVMYLDRFSYNPIELAIFGVVKN